MARRERGARNPVGGREEGARRGGVEDRAAQGVEERNPAAGITADGSDRETRLFAVISPAIETPHHGSPRAIDGNQMSTARSRKRDRYLGSAFWAIVSLLLGWTLYVYWWWVVLHDDQPDPLARMLVAIAVLAALLLLATMGWIGHNQRLARRGGRGKASRLRTAVFDRDALDRPIEFADLRRIRAASIVIVHSDAASKRFAPGYRDDAKAIDHRRGTGTRG